MGMRRTSKYCVLVFLFFLCACATRPSRYPETISPHEDGSTVAAHLQQRFDESVADCGSATRPAFLCSGIMLRGTKYSTGYHSWIPNPATSAGGVSFSWLRNDSNIYTFFLPNGFIVYPHFYADDGNYETLSVRCGYISNASTGSKPDKCPGTCQSLGIHTAAAFQGAYPTGVGCPFQVWEGTSDSASAWMALGEVRRLRNLTTWNEIIIAQWPQTTYASMPLEAFFIIGANGLPGAQLDQKDFKATAGRWVPIVRLTPGTAGNGRVLFTYSATDQAILN
ncbi:hypothetical protein [Luteibacter yeojuensis]